MAVFNYTGRKAIPHNAIFLTSTKDAPCLTVFMKNSIAEMTNYGECQVIFEAYFHTKIQRLELGLAKDLPSKAEAKFTDFLEGEGVLFRIKLVDSSTKMIRMMGERFSIAKKSNQPVVHSEENEHRSPISVRWAEDDDNMNGRFWKVRLSHDYTPTLLLQRGKFVSVNEVNSPAFTALAKPSILKEILTYAFLTHFDNWPTWAQDWIDLAVKVLGCGEDAPKEEYSPESSSESLSEYCEKTELWIDHAVGAFAQKCGIKDITSDFRRN